MFRNEFADSFVIFFFCLRFPNDPLFVEFVTYVRFAGKLRVLIRAECVVYKRGVASCRQVVKFWFFSRLNILG